ncbi:hypothetical protein ACA910_013270 [Epithemia clementina (nom. ined.)]
MGNVWVPDKPCTLDEILASLDILQQEFLLLNYGQRRLKVCLTASMLITGYTAALRGEELSLIDIGMMNKSWQEGRDYSRKPYIPLALVGRFKQTNGALKTFIQPLAPVTKSGIRVQEWLGRTIDKYDKMKIGSGPMFRIVTKGGTVKRATVWHLDDLLHDILK